MAEYTEAFSESDEYIQHICDLCIQDDQEIEAKAFCTVCMQYICQSCYKSHLRANVSKDHKCLTGKDIPSKQTKSQIMPRCKKHPEQGFEQFCFDHRVVLCKTCKIIDHRNCKTDQISTLSSDALFKNESKLKITSLKKMLAEFSRLEKMSEAKVVDLDLQRKDAIKNVRKVKENINQYLDTLEKRIVAKINQSVRHGVAQLSRKKEEIGCLVKELEKELEGYQEMQTGAVGSDHAFVMSINMEAEIGKYIAILNDIGVYLPDTKLDIDETLSNFQFQVQSFGNFEVVQTQKLQEEKDIVHLTTVKIGSSVDKTVCKVNSVEMTNDVGLLVCDGGRKKVMLYDPNYKEISEISFLDTPYHLAMVSHD